MPETITATYKNGCLHPLFPLNLPDNESVSIIILPAKPPDKSNEIIRIMVKAGLIRTSRLEKGSIPPDPVSEQERIEIAKKLGQNQDKMLSEIIISDRDQ